MSKAKSFPPELIFLMAVVWGMAAAFAAVLGGWA